MAALPTPPFIIVPGIHNFRDIGGYPTATRRSQAINFAIRRGLIFRCAATTDVTEEGKRQIQQLGITSIFDLRSNTELGKTTLAISGVQVIPIPIFGDKGFAPEDIVLRYQEEGFAGAYLEILELGGPAFRRFLEHIRDNPSEPCLIHCTMGKDRTGLACALALALAGCDDETVAAEYALTQLGTNKLGPQLLEKFSRYPGLEGHEEVIKALLDSRKETMMVTLDMIKTRYGGVEGYMKQQCGFTINDIELIRSNLVEEATGEAPLILLKGDAHHLL